MSRDVDSRRALFVVRLLHTAVWAVMASAILALPLCAIYGLWDWAIGIVALILIEGIVLLFNGWRCPLTDVAARFTDERHDNFDIFLPLWLAKWNKLIFGSLFVVGLIVFGVTAFAMAQGGVEH